MSRILAVLLVALFGCGTSAPALTQCALYAVTPLASQLERDPEHVTPADVLDAAHALRSCKMQADAGQ